MCKIELVTLKSETGFTVEILPLGGIVMKIMANDRNNIRKNVVLSYDFIEDYKENSLFLGCIIGPVAGRTEKGMIKLGKKTIQLDTSCHPNSLHSCSDGLHLVNWNILSKGKSELVLTHHSKTHNCSVYYEITYSVSGETLTIQIVAIPSMATYLSLTNHSYFNLTGNTENQIINHVLKLHCTHYGKLNHDNLPIQLAPLKNSVMDFSTSRIIKEALEASGIDHPFKRGKSGTVAELSDPVSGRRMHVQTTQPYVVVYTGNFLDSYTSPSGKIFGKHTGICFETQDLPNVTNNKLDDINTVTPESPYKHVTSYTFSTC